VSNWQLVGITVGFVAIVLGLMANLFDFDLEDLPEFEDDEQ
jgi:hypothetical protein